MIKQPLDYVERHTHDFGRCQQCGEEIKMVLIRVKDVGNFCSDACYDFFDLQAGYQTRSKWIKTGIVLAIAFIGIWIFS